RVEAFGEALALHAEAVLPEEALEPRITVDAIVPRCLPLTLELCSELRSLAPFGLGNPSVTLLAPGCELSDLATVGEGRHLRFRVRRDGRDTGSAIAFGLGSRLERLASEGSYDVAFRLEENRWNGTVAPQLVVTRVFDAEPRVRELWGWLAAEIRKPAAQRDAVAEENFRALEPDTAPR